MRGTRRRVLGRDLRIARAAGALAEKLRGHPADVEVAWADILGAARAAGDGSDTHTDLVRTIGLAAALGGRLD